MKATNTELNMTLVADTAELAQKALEAFVADARRAIQSRDRFCAAISRQTPKGFFRLLGEDTRSRALSWDRIHLFWVDECCGSSDLAGGGYGPAACSFIPEVGIPAENVHRICCEDCNCEYVASIYERTIHNVVGVANSGMPEFDLIMLGMGADGHIASLFPDTYAFYETGEVVCVTYFMDRRCTRITLTHPVLCAARHVMVLVCGSQRGAILGKVLSCEPDEVRYPLHAIWPILDRVTWLVDRGAASELISVPCLSSLRCAKIQPRRAG
jgi:6-phosphogluconolactonase